MSTIDPNDYDEIKKALGELPQTWYPALIQIMVLAAYEKNVFVRGGASAYIQKIEETLAEVDAMSREESQNNGA